MTDSSRPTCFVISPIGKPDSDARRNANDFLELLVEPALATFDFDVVRADKINRPSMIMADIIRPMQEAELCVVDLTGNNPNVFYECGRRHESGRPSIQMVSKSTEISLPFDVAGIRTIVYDLSSPRSTNQSQAVLREYVQQFADSGFKTATSGESLTSIAHGIERIERKVGQLLIGGGGTKTAGPKLSSLEMAIRPPQEIYKQALISGEHDLAFEILPRLKLAAGHKEYVAAAGLLAATGNERAFTLVERAR